MSSVVSSLDDEGPHVHEWGAWVPDPMNTRLLRDIEYACCACGASKARRAEDPMLLFHTDASECRTKSCPQDDHFETPPRQPQEPVCGACEGPHDTEDCKSVEGPEEICELPHETMEEEDECDRRRFAAKEPPAPRRPPYAVAYVVQGGALYEVAVPGDAIVVAEDGALQVLHPKRPVLAIVRVTPMNMEESDG